MNNFAETYVAHVLEDEVPPGAEVPPDEAGVPAAPAARTQRERWDSARKSFQKLWDLTLKKQDTMREMGRAIAYERALSYVDITRDDVRAHIRAEDVYATTPIPRGHPLRDIRFRFSKKYPTAIVGVQTKDGREIFFDEPLMPEYGQAVTYEQFSAVEKARAERSQAARQHGWE